MAFVSTSTVVTGISCASGLALGSCQNTSSRASAPFYLRSQRTRAPANTKMMAGGGPPKKSVECDTPLKVFIFKLKGLGDVRIIVRNAAGILEAVSDFSGAFFASIPSGEYANLIDHSKNLDMHLLLSEVGGAKFEEGIGRGASKAPTYIIRLLGLDMESQVLSLFLLSEGVEQERIDCWKALKAEYGAGEGGDVVSFQ
jgi:hypothetical protein